MSKKVDISEEEASLRYHKAIVDDILQQATLCGTLMVAKGQTPSIFLELNNTEECRIDAANVRLKGGHIPSLHDIINEKINAGASRDILNDLINKALNDKNKWECKSSVADALSMTVTNVSTCTQLPIVPFKPIHPRERR